MSPDPQPLRFGTAGIRAPVGPGPDRMNRSTVGRIVDGVAVHLLDTVPDARQRGVVVARDARHGSADFAEEATEVLRGRGIAVHLFDEPVPTPLAAHAVPRLAAAAAVIVTASHNPSTDNGLKVVWHDGAQVGPPVDAGIEAAVDTAAPQQRRSAVGPLEHLGGATGDHPVVRSYLDRARDLLEGPLPTGLRVAYTPLHGVGAGLWNRAVEGCGGVDIHTVTAQEVPDPDFPTVSSPNPEDTDALEALITLAADCDADVAVAHDPDADRLAICAPEPDGAWRALGGDELGVLLLAHLLDRTSLVPDRLVATTMVSSRLAGRICRARGVHFRETATGFKWLCRPGIRHPEWHQVLLYEEALGYAVGNGSRDKDGITAGLIALEMFAGLANDGISAGDALDELARSHGAFVQTNGSLRWGSPAAAGLAIDRFMASAPRSLGGSTVLTTRRPAADCLRLELDHDTRLMLRPSGTEPKLKYYCEAVEPVAPGRPPSEARSIAAERASRVVEELRLTLTG
jgi:phosphomannomutase